MESGEDPVEPGVAPVEHGAVRVESGGGLVESGGAPLKNTPSQRLQGSCLAPAGPFSSSIAVLPASEASGPLSGSDCRLRDFALYGSLIIIMIITFVHQHCQHHFFMNIAIKILTITIITIMMREMV